MGLIPLYDLKEINVTFKEKKLRYTLKEEYDSLLKKILKADFKTLKEYINENLKKGFIKLLNSLIRSLVLFVLKKNRKKRLYIDY